MDLHLAPGTGVHSQELVEQNDYAEYVNPIWVKFGSSS